MPTQVGPGELKHPHALARCLSQEMETIVDGQYVLLVAGFRSDEQESEPMMTVLKL